MVPSGAVKSGAGTETELIKVRLKDIHLKAQAVSEERRRKTASREGQQQLDLGSLSSLDLSVADAEQLRMMSSNLEI